MELRWFLAALLALIFWGTWGLLGRLLSQQLGWREMTALAALGQLVASMSFIVILRPSILHVPTLTAMGLLTGALGFLGATMFYVALEANPSSIVVVTTSLYPMVTVVLALILLGEIPNPRQLLALAFALAALVLFATS
ncbi:MAG: DMT family transporter [Thaumarchaeota archaeon]|nr:DMT family transporter [Candidatus Calditenuaceae archaeon]MDW8041748.1 EamA family transporter [Nitrososphaerota archaeon]